MGEIIETLDYKKTAKLGSRYERIEIKKYFYSRAFESIKPQAKIIAAYVAASPKMDTSGFP